MNYMYGYIYKYMFVFGDCKLEAKVIVVIWSNLLTYNYVTLIIVRSV